MANLTYRAVKGTPLTIGELDGNFEYFTGSHAITGSLTISGSLTVTGTITGSVFGTSSFAQTAVTASYVSSLLTIAPSNPLPSLVNGAIAFSSSGDFYFGSGSAWRKLTL
jgi:hypothetical protein